MLQQTRVNTVIPYYAAFLGKYPTVGALAGADPQEVLKVWEGLGYYARARNLYKAAVIVDQRYRGKIPADYRELRALPGVGEYVAAAVASIAFDQPYPVIDGNVKRVLARFAKIEAPVNDSAMADSFKKMAVKFIDAGRPGIYNQALMELGALLCTPKNPHCALCPVSACCGALSKGLVSQYPKRIQKDRIPLYQIVVGVVLKADKLLITRRKENGLLGGLWEFPGGKVNRDEDPRDACLREIREEVNLEIAIEEYLARVKHAYTHFRIEMDVFICRYIFGEIILKGPVDFRWISIAEIDRYPFPKSNHKFFARLKEALQGR